MLHNSQSVFLYLMAFGLYEKSRDPLVLCTGVVRLRRG
jgi:hypothetical protein